MLKKMIKNLSLLVIVGLLNGCGVATHAPTNNTNVVAKDSIFVKDTTIIRDTIIKTEIPREKVMDIISQMDTSRLETSVAKSTAFVDTTSLMIKHTLENKDVELEKEFVYVDRVVTKVEVVYRDSVSVKEVPVEVTVEKKVYPKTYWWLLGFFVITVGIFIVRIYFRFKK